MRKFLAAAIAAAVISSTSFAVAGDLGALAPGKPAGVQKAQTGNEVVVIVVGIGALGMLAALAGGGGGSGGGGSNNNASAPTGTP